ncbi:MAG: DnaJ domain-containing protein [Archangium sp.]|nr:DnaJ domain-containing protein [Archangium sp.]MDP3157030.1 DnaJ domain-containing protein [Archangium sp.]MDP3575747.1 DnaJ domain-containing protein [Archangium sp.]
MSGEPLQVWVRNDKGQVYGPLSPPSIELLIDNSVIAGRMQISTDGVNYVFPGRVPGLRMIFPKDTWGDTVVPGEQLDAQWATVVLPAALPSQVPMSSPSGISAAPAGGPVAGPGARAPAGGPTAGPGTRPQPGRGMVPGQVGASRPSSAGMPAMRSSPSVANFMNNPTAPGSSVRSSLSGVSAAPMRSSPSVADFMNTPAPPMRSSPSVADFMNSAQPAAPAPPRPPVAAPATSSSGSGLRAAPPAGPSPLPPSGKLEEHSAQQLYSLAAASEVNGLLTVTLPDRELAVHFKKGNPEYVDSTHVEDSLDTFLLAQKLATQAQIDQAQAQSARFGGELLSALFGLGLLNPNAVFQHLGQRASLLLHRALTAEQGTFTFDLEELPASRSMPMGNKWAVYLEALRKVPMSDVRRRLNRALELPVMKGAGRVAVNDLRLTPQETRALNYFDGVRSLQQLMKDVPAEADTILRTAWMLAPLELISYASVNPNAPKASAAPPPPAPAPAKPVISAPVPPRPVVAAPTAAPPVVTSPAPAAPVVTTPPARPTTAPGNPAQMPRPAMPYPAAAAPQRPLPPVMKPAAAAPATPTATAASAAAETKALQATHDLMKKQNFFEVLGLKKDADANAVKMAYLKAARSYHPDTVAPGSPESLAKLKADVFALIGEANRTLSDPGLRKEYTAELDAGGTGSKVDIEKILRAEEVFQKGRILVQARKYPDAVKMFEEAVGCNADEAEFYAWRGYAKFLAATDRKAVLTEVMRDLNLCVAKNPNVAATYFFLGFVAQKNGDEKTAMINFKKCVALDPKHIDAQRELRSIKK